MVTSSARALWLAPMMTRAASPSKADLINPEMALLIMLTPSYLVAISRRRRLLIPIQASLPQERTGQRRALLTAKSQVNHVLICSEGIKNQRDRGSRKNRQPLSRARSAEVSVGINHHFGFVVSLSKGSIAGMPLC